MKLKLPPPIIFLLTLGLIWLLPDSQNIEAFRPLVLPLCALAIVIGGLSVWAFHQAKTTVDPRHPEATSALVQHGIFRFSRNPMYLSLLMLLLAFVFWRGNLFGIGYVASCAIYLHHFQILPEEAVLKAKFGHAYQDYCAKVRRWC